MKKVWLDVGTMLSWKRSAVGVVRVEVECAAYILKLDSPEFAFCQLSPNKKLIEVDSEQVKNALQFIYYSNQSAVQELPNQSRILRLCQKIAIYLRDFWPAAYNTLRHAEPRIKAAVLNLELRIKKILAASKRTKSPPAALARIDSGDVYLSMGADWGRGNLDYLYALKKQLGFRAVLFCYDIIPIKFPHLTLSWVAKVFPSYFCNLAWTADSILAISECSKQDLTQYLKTTGAPQPPIDVVYLGSQIEPGQSENISAAVEEVLQKPFILYVSTIERRKNHEVLYRAYVHLVDQGIHDLPQLVFVGMKGWGVSDFVNDIGLDMRTKSHITILNHANDTDLCALYQHALFTVYPSLYEGWGLPVAESLTLGQFCIASSTSSLPEVGGDLIEYIDPWDVYKWAERIHWYATHPDELEQKTDAIRTNYQPYQWQETGKIITDKALALLHAERS